MCPQEYMPDLSDPAALSLVLCLLEVDGEKFGELALEARDEINISWEIWTREARSTQMTRLSLRHGSVLLGVDAVFTPYRNDFPTGSYKKVPAVPPGSGSLSINTPFTRYNGQNSSLEVVKRSRPQKPSVVS